MTKNTLSVRGFVKCSKTEATCVTQLYDDKQLLSKFKQFQAMSIFVLSGETSIQIRLYFCGKFFLSSLISDFSSNGPGDLTP